MAKGANKKTFTFGTYRGEKIDWLILETVRELRKSPSDYERGEEGDGVSFIGKKSDKALLISRVCVDSHCFREDWLAEDANQWVASDIRSWLNKDFLEMAFSTEEQKRIIETRVATEDCADTKDRIFLLSVDEARRYFKRYEHRKSTLNGKSWWWLRSPGNYSCNAAFIHSTGALCNYGDYVYCENLVRPALWVNLES